MEKFTPYPKPDKFLGKKKSETESEITPVYRASDMHEIATGNFGKVNRFTAHDEKGNDLEFANKQNIENDSGKFDPEKIQHDLEVHSRLQQAGIPTFQDYYTDGSSLYSNFLNTEDIIAISPSDKKSRFADLKITITDGQWSHIEEQIDEILESATENGIKLPWDCFFVIVSKSQRPPKILVGDFDLISINHNLEPHMLSVYNDNSADSAMRQLRNRL